MRLSVAVLQLALLLAALPTHVSAAKKKSGSKKSSEEPILELTDATVEDELKKNPLMLISFTVPGCADCELVAKALRQAKAELRVQSADSVTLAQLTITSQESPAVARITQGQLQLPKLLVFRDGEAMDYVGTELTKKDIVSTMLREYSRPSVQALSSVKQTERFLHLDSWSAQHADEEQPPRVVGFFPSNGTAGYAVYRAMASKLQGMISFGECFDPVIQKKFLGAPARKTIVQVVKADKKERKVQYAGALAVPPMARWVATHSLALVQDLTTESSISDHMARGVPVFLLLMPDEYAAHTSSQFLRNSCAIPAQFPAQFSDGLAIPSTGDIKWTRNATLLMVPAAVGAGVAAGLLGIGGGMILGPLFVALNFQPQVGTATTGFMILFTAFGGTVKYVAVGRLPWQYLLWFGGIGIAGGQTGQRVVKKLLAKTGRPSLVVFILGSIIALAVTIMTASGIINGVNAANTGANLFCFDLSQFICDPDAAGSSA